MDIKKKLQTLVKPKGKSAENEVSSGDFKGDPAVSKFKEHHQSLNYDPRIDTEIINAIDEVYFKMDQFDPTDYELQKLPSVPVMSQIDDDRIRLRKQHQSVSKKMSELILENHPAYAVELQRVMELQDDLVAASTVCLQSRSMLSTAQMQFTRATLQMFGHHRKQQRLHKLLKSLRTIKTLQRTDVRLQEMLEKEDYPSAIELCLECQRAASVYRHYNCISELSAKLQDTLEMIEEKLDTALSRTCGRFDEKYYEGVHLAYALLGKTQTAMDQLHMHYTAMIQNTAFTIVVGYVELVSGMGDSSFQRKQYGELCKFISPETFMPCLMDLCKALWDVMLSYHKTIQWHRRHEDLATTEEADNLDSAFTRRYVEQKFASGLPRMWQEIQIKINTFLLASDLSKYKFPQFIHILNLVNRLISVGEEFCGSASEILKDGTLKQTTSYFKQYHRASLDELSMFLENESWEICPVRATFTLFQLQEFKFMKNGQGSSQFAINAGIGGTPKRAGSSDTVVNQSGGPAVVENGRVSRFFDQQSDRNPFDLQAEEDQQEDFFTSTMAETRDSDSDDDIPDELKGDYIDELTGRTSVKSKGGFTPRRTRSRSMVSTGKDVPILTNTSLTVLRLIGKYIRMMDLLSQISYDVITCASQLFDYYFQSVYDYFAKQSMEDGGSDMSVVSSKFQATLARIKDSGAQNGWSERHTESSLPPPMQPHLLPQPDGARSTEETIRHLSRRVVAVESLVFLAKQFEVLQHHFESNIPGSKKAFLQQFYSQTVSVAGELRGPAYQPVTEKVINQPKVVDLISGVRWDIKDIMSQHSAYVDVILKDLQTFASLLAEASSHVPITKPVLQVVWEQCSRQAATAFVEGYSNVKKCTNEGRALMQLDFQQYLMKLEKVIEIRPVPSREYVEMYIKAYYFPDAQLEQWIKDHREYTGRQMAALISVVPHLNRKTRQRLTALVEEIHGGLSASPSVNKLITMMRSGDRKGLPTISLPHVNISRSSKEAK